MKSLPEVAVVTIIVAVADVIKDAVNKAVVTKDVIFVEDVAEEVIHPWQDLKTILSGFLLIATTSSMYGAVTRGEHVSITNYQSAIDVADVLIANLRAIIHGSGLGKFEGTPNCASWFGQTPPSSGKNSGGGGLRDHDTADPRSND